MASAATKVRKTGSEPRRHSPLAAVGDKGLSDETLAISAAKGDTEAFAELVNRYQSPVYSIAYRMLGQSADAEDAAQETFLRAYSKLESYRPEAKFGTWLLSIAAHFCIDQLRRKQSVSLDDVPDLDRPGRQDEEPESSALEKETRDEVQAMLQVLPPKYRAPLVLRYWYDHSYAEIAEVLRLSEATVKTRLFRARQMLIEASKGRSLSGSDQGLNKRPRIMAT